MNQSCAWRSSRALLMLGMLVASQASGEAFNACMSARGYSVAP